jgi:hypothetical protein
LLDAIDIHPVRHLAKCVENPNGTHHLIFRSGDLLPLSVKKFGGVDQFLLAKQTRGHNFHPELPVRKYFVFLLLFNIDNIRSKKSSENIESWNLNCIKEGPIGKPRCDTKAFFFQWKNI